VKMLIIFMNQMLNSFYADDDQSTITASQTKLIELLYSSGSQPL